MRRFATVSHNYAARYPDELSVFEEELVEVLAYETEASGFCRVLPVARTIDSGLVPTSYLVFEDGGEIEQTEQYEETPQEYSEEAAYDQNGYYADDGNYYEYDATYYEEGAAAAVEDGADATADPSDTASAAPTSKGLLGRLKTKDSKEKKKSKTEDDDKKKKKKKGSVDEEDVSKTLKGKKSLRSRSVDDLPQAATLSHQPTLENQPEEGEWDADPADSGQKRRSNSFSHVVQVTIDSSPPPPQGKSGRSISPSSASSAGSSSIASLFKGRKKKDEPYLDAGDTTASASSSISSLTLGSTSDSEDSPTKKADEPNTKKSFLTWSAKKSAPKGKIPSFDRTVSRPITVMVPAAPSGPIASLSPAAAGGILSPLSASGGGDAGASPSSTASASPIVITPTAAPPSTKRMWYDKFADPAEREAVLASMSKSEKMFQAAAHELRDTEQDYLDDLNFIISYFKKRMTEQHIMKQESIDYLFSNIEELKNVSEWLIYELDTLAAESYNPPLIHRIADAFLKSAPYFTHYTIYCINQPHAMELYRRKMDKDIFSAFIKEARNNPDCKGLTLESFLIKPVQRICKYPLLIRELLRHCGDDHEDKDALEAAMGAVEAVVLDVNEGKRRAENLEKLSEIAGRIKFDDLKAPGTDDPLVIVNSARQFLYEGTVTALQDGKPNGERQLLLFDDILIVCSRGAKPRALLMFEVATLGVNDFANDADESKKSTVALFRTGQRYRTVFHYFDLGVFFNKWISEFEKVKVARNIDAMANTQVSAKELILLRSMRAQVGTQPTAEEEMESYKREAEQKATEEAERQRQVIAASVAAIPVAATDAQKRADKAAKKRVMDQARRDIIAQSGASHSKKRPPVPARTYQTSASAQTTRPAQATSAPVTAGKAATPLPQPKPLPKPPASSGSSSALPLPSVTAAAPVPTASATVAAPVPAPAAAASAAVPAPKPLPTITKTTSNSALPSASPPSSRVPSGAIAAAAAAVAAGIRPSEIGARRSTLPSMPVQSESTTATASAVSPVPATSAVPAASAVPAVSATSAAPAVSGESAPSAALPSPLSPGRPPPLRGPKPSQSAIDAAAQRRMTMHTTSSSSSVPDLLKAPQSDDLASASASANGSPRRVSNESSDIRRTPVSDHRQSVVIASAAGSREAYSPLGTLARSTIYVQSPASASASSDSLGGRVMGARKAPWEK